MPHIRSADFERHTAVVVGAVLLVATYFIFSLRTLIDPVEPGELLSLKRFAAAAVGTATFWMVVRGARRLPFDRLGERAVSLALRFLAAFAIVMATRVGYDLLITGDTEAMIAKNLRWLMAWAGYFVAALIAYFAIVSARAARHRSISAFASREDAVTWFVAEVSTWGEADRQAITDLIAARPAYEEADPLGIELAR